MAEEQDIRLWAAIESMTEAVLIIDMHGKVSMLNRAGRGLLGGTPEGMHIEDLIKRYQIRDLRGRPLFVDEAPSTAALKKGKVAHFEGMLRAKGRDVFVNATASPIKTDTGEVSGVVVTLRDTSAQKEQEGLRDEFISVTSHDLKARLAIIKGYTQILKRYAQRSNWTDAQLESFRIIDEEVGRMVQLVNELRDVSRVETGKLTLQSEPADLVRLTRNVVSSLQAATQQHQIELIEESPNAVGEWDKARVEQAIRSLLANAIKYSPEGGEIQVRAGCMDGWAYFSVRDCGAGISPEELPGIFEAFHRKDAAGGKGFDFALYIARAIIEAHGGQIKAESQGLGQDATFSFTLPGATCTEE